MPPLEDDPAMSVLQNIAFAIDAFGIGFGWACRFQIKATICESEGLRVHYGFGSSNRINLPEDQRMQLRGATRLHDQHIANRPGVSGLQVSFAADSAGARDGAELGDMDLGYHAMA